MAQINKITLPDGTTHNLVPGAGDIVVKSKLYFEAVDEDNVTYKKLVAEYVAPDPEDIDTTGTLTVYDLSGNAMFTMDMNSNRFDLLSVLYTLSAGKLNAKNLTANRILVSDANKNIVSSGYEFDISTNNTSDTQLLVMNGSKIQHRLSTNLSVNYATSAGSASSATNATNATYINPLATGRASNPNDGNSIVIFKRVTNTEAPNNGVVLEFGNSTSWRGQLFIGDNSTQGIAWNGWSNGKRGSWLTFLHSGNYSSYALPLSGGTLTGALTIPGGTFLTWNGNHGRILGNTDSQIYICAGGTLIRNFANNAWQNIAAAKFNINSSRLIKENIQAISDEEAKKLLKLNVVEFDYKKGYGSEGKQRGLIAEDVIDIIPSVVSKPENYNEDKIKQQLAKGEFAMTLSIDYSQFTPYLIKMVQIQQRQIEELKAEVERLKDVIES